MTTASVRKFIISLDPEEPVDFAKPLTYFEELLGDMGLEKIGSYTFRYTDRESLIKVDLSETSDGFLVYVYVQAPNEHEYRIEEIAEELGGYILLANAMS